MQLILMLYLRNIIDMTKIYIDYENKTCLGNLNDGIHILDGVNTYLKSPYSFRYNTRFSTILNDIKLLKRDLQSLSSWLSGSLRDYRNFDENLKLKVSRLDKINLKKNIKIVK